MTTFVCIQAGKEPVLRQEGSALGEDHRPKNKEYSTSYIDHIPANRIEPLAWLGKTDWLKPNRGGYEHSRNQLQLLLNRSLRLGRDFANQIREIINLSISPEIGNAPGMLASAQYAHIFYMASKILATGRKTIRLSSDWCEAFEETELTLRFRDYKQPYSTMVVELPANYAQAKRVPGSTDYPVCVALHHEESANVLLVEVVFANSQSNLLVPFSPDDQVEDVLRNVLVQPNQEADYAGMPQAENYLAAYMRIGLNAVVSMVYGTDWEKVDLTATERRAKRRHKEQTNSRDAATAERAGLRLRTFPEVFQFHQTIEAFAEEIETPFSEARGDGPPRKPHWRRGHWRQQPVGQGRMERRLLWIRPVLVNASRFTGDLKDTTTTYVAE